MELHPLVRNFKYIKEFIRDCNSVRFRRYFSESKLRKIKGTLKSCMRTIRSLAKDNGSLKHKNKQLAVALQTQRQHCNNYLQELIVTDGSYQELLSKNASIKAELRKLQQITESWDEDLTNLVPDLVKLSDGITKLKLKANKYRKSGGRTSCSLSKTSFPQERSSVGRQQLSAAVNPMIQGCVIQKPIINVDRLSIPNARNGRSFISNLGYRVNLFDSISLSSPIMEEAEEEQPASTSNSVNRKCEGGLRRLLQKRNQRSAVPADEQNHSNSEEEEMPGLEPVVLLSDVQQLLQNSLSTIKVQNSEISRRKSESTKHKSQQSHVSPRASSRRLAMPKSKKHSVKNTESELVGCSWMFDSTTGQISVPEKQTKENEPTPVVKLEAGSDSKQCSEKKSLLNVTYDINITKDVEVFNGFEPSAVIEDNVSTADVGPPNDNMLVTTIMKKKYFPDVRKTPAATKRVMPFELEAEPERIAEPTILAGRTDSLSIPNVTFRKKRVCSVNGPDANKPDDVITEPKSITAEENPEQTFIVNKKLTDIKNDTTMLSESRRSPRVQKSTKQSDFFYERKYPKRIQNEDVTSTTRQSRKASESSNSSSDVTDNAKPPKKSRRPKEKVMKETIKKDKLEDDSSIAGRSRLLSDSSNISDIESTGTRRSKRAKPIVYKEANLRVSRRSYDLE